VKTLFLVIAAVLSVAAIVPYIRDVFQGKTKPNLVSWITWSLLTGIATAAEITGHQYVTAVFTGSTAAATFAVVLSGLKHGYVKYTSFDVICQIAAVVGLVLWLLFNSPTIGIVASVLIDFAGALPTFRHMWLKPREETLSTYVIEGVGGFFAIAALSKYTVVSLTYVIYIVVMSLTMAGLITIRRRARVPHSMNKN
jgi:hypothetical protein